jgi:hypothetical protein
MEKCQMILEKDNKLYYCLDYLKDMYDCHEYMTIVNRDLKFPIRLATLSEYNELIELKYIKPENSYWLDNGIVSNGIECKLHSKSSARLLLVHERDNTMRIDEGAKTLEVEVSTECVKYVKVNEILRRYNNNCSKYNFRLIRYFEYKELFNMDNFQKENYWIDGGLVSNGTYYKNDSTFFKNDILRGEDYRKLLMVRTVKKEKSVLDCFLYPDEEYPFSIGNVRLTLSDAIILSKKIQDNINNYNEYLTGKNKKIYDIENKIKELYNELEQLKK